MKCAAIAIALIATCAALPYVEESWHAEDELLHRVYEDSSPMSELLQASPGTVNTANKAALKHNIKAAKYGAKEKTFAGAEKKAEEKAKGLAEADTKLKKEAAVDNAAADKAEGKFKLSAMAKIGAASAATDKAEARETKRRIAYKLAMKALKKQGENADKKAKNRVAKTKALLDAAKAATKEEKKKQAAIAEQEKADAAKLLKSNNDAEKKFEDDEAANAKELKEANEEAKKDDDKAQTAFRNDFLNNKKKEKKQEEEIENEKKQNAKDAAEETRKINEAGKKRDEEEAKLVKEEHKQLEEKKTAESNRRKGVREKAHKKMLENKAKQAVTAEKVAKAKQAAKEAKEAKEASVKKAAKDQAATEKDTEEEDKEDGAMKECATDGSECLQCEKVNADKEKCHCVKIGVGGPPYFAADDVSCSSVPAKQPTWYTVAPNAPPTEPVAADEEKCKAIIGGATGVLKAAFDGMKTTCPLVAVACAKDKMTFAARKAAMHSVIQAGENCKPMCFQGTGTATDDGVADTHGICIDPDDYKGASEMLDKNNEYKAMGTGGRFKAGPPPDLCNWATQMVCGLTGGAGVANCK